MRRYVVGLAFSAVANRVLLLRKGMGTINEGLWNGVGGKVEEGEHPDHCMAREAAEEIGSDALGLSWVRYAHVYGPDYQLIFYYATASESAIPERTAGPEPTCWFGIQGALAAMAPGVGCLVRDLPEMLAMALRKFKARDGKIERVFRRPVDRSDAAISAGEAGYDALAQVRPAYYGGPDDPYEAIKVIQAWGLDFALGSVLKYVRRAGVKDSGTWREDLLKARTYIDLELADPNSGGKVVDRAE